MTIFLDVSAAVHQRAGLGRYAASLAHEMARLLPTELGLFYNAERGVEPLAGFDAFPRRTVALGYKPWRMMIWGGQVARLGFDRLVTGATLFHATEHLLMPLRHSPTILTVHDLIFLHLPQHHRRLNRWYLSLTLPLYCRRADRIIAVSSQTRDDLIRRYGIPAEKIRVILEAADSRFRAQEPDRVVNVRHHHGLPERYILSVGTIEPRKNLGRLLHAFEALHAERLTDALVIVGKRGWLYDDFFGELAQSPARQAVIFPGFVPDEELPALYAGAQALAFPSLFEGFGLPVAEAMACGTPVVCSNSSSLPEVAGDAALLVDPLQQDDLTHALRTLLTDRSLAEELRARGVRRAGQLSWSRAAQDTLDLYREAMR